jgi:hypothetical protein
VAVVAQVQPLADQVVRVVAVMVPRPLLEPLVVRTLAVVVVQVRAAAHSSVALAVLVWSSFAFVPHKQSDNERKRAWLTLHA